MPRYKSTTKLDRAIGAKMRSDIYAEKSAEPCTNDMRGSWVNKWTVGMARVEHDRFVKHLKKLREHAGWSVRELAERAGVDHSQLVRLESGERSCTLETAVNIVGALGVRLGILAE